MLPAAPHKAPKACTTCAKAKARCIPRADGGLRCERCHRLDRHCLSRPPAPPRRRTRPKRSRVAELEKRLNELSSQFVHAHRPARAATAKVPPDKSHLLSLEHLFPSPSSTESTDTSARRQSDSPWPLPAEAAVLLQQYHGLFAHLFPFVLVPRHVAAADLRNKRPFVCKAVMLASCVFDGPRQARLGDDMLAEIARAAVVEGARSLDLLQGLQLLIACFYFALKSSQVANLLFLARSMCVNLDSMSYASRGEDTQYGDLDHVRAYAGTYYLNTLVFTANKRPDVLMDTSQLASCCEVLQRTMEHPSDTYLVSLVRIQQLAQTISLAMAFEPARPAMSLPLPMVVESFQDQLDTFRATLPADLAENPTLECHIAVAEMLLSDVAISDQHCSSAKVAPADRVQLLRACARSLRAFFRVRFANAAFEQPRFLSLITSDLAYAFITGIKLLTLRLPGWHLEQHMGKDLALDRILAHQIDDLGDVIAKRNNGRAADRPGPEDPLERLLRLLQTAQELVALQLTGLSPQDIAHDVVRDMNDGAVWQDWVNDSAWTNVS